MLPEDKYFQTLSETELWQRYCGFLELPLEEFIEIQKHLLMEQIELVAGSPLGKKIIGNSKPKSVEEFRRVVPLTTYDDYEPYLSERQEDVLAVKPYFWTHSSGKGGRYKWFPQSSECVDTAIHSFIASCILSSSTKKGKVNIRPGFCLFAVLPPPPYTSGTVLETLSQRITFRPIPPPKQVEGMEFPDKVQKGFQIALKDGVDVLGAITSVLVAMGQEFGKPGRSRGPLKSMLHPLVIFRLLRAVTRSKREKRPMLPKDLWSPKGIVAGGIDTSIYKKDVAYYWGVEPLDFYVSAETLFVAMQAWNKKAMTFIANSVFLEFIPYDKKSENTDIKDSHPHTVLLNELEEGKLYEVILTQFHGMPLLRYRINDLIKVVALKDEEAGIHLPQIMIQRKVGESIGLGGLADIDEKTIWQAIVDSGIKFVDWTARKEIDQNQSFIRLYIELKEQREAGEIATMIDNQLKIVDADYRDIGTYLKLQPVKVTLLPPGTFDRYIAEKRREGADLAHLKPVRVNPPEEILQRLLR